MGGGVSPLVEVEEVLQGRRRIYTHSGYTTRDNGSYMYMYMGPLIYTKLFVKFPLLFLLRTHNHSITHNHSAILHSQHTPKNYNANETNTAHTFYDL